MLSNKFVDDKNIINSVIGTNRERKVKDGYYVINICDKENICNNDIYVASNKNKESGKEFYIFGKLLDGVMTELITGTILKYIDDVDMIVDEKETNGTKYELPVFCNFYFSSPCYMMAWQIYPNDLVEILKDLDENYNVDEYRNKILSQINNATSKYDELMKDDEVYIKSFISKHKKKNRTLI